MAAIARQQPRERHLLDGTAWNRMSVIVRMDRGAPDRSVHWRSPKY
jgi:hypothetical protein